MKSSREMFQVPQAANPGNDAHDTVTDPEKIHAKVPFEVVKAENSEPLASEGATVPMMKPPPENNGMWAQDRQQLFKRQQPK